MRRLPLVAFMFCLGSAVVVFGALSAASARPWQTGVACLLGLGLSWGAGAYWALWRDR